MKYLMMCEGTNELKIMQILLFSSDELLGLVPFHARQIKTSPPGKQH